MVLFRFFEVVFSGMFFLFFLFFLSYPNDVQNRGGGVKATFGQCPKGSSFFLGITSLTVVTQS